MDKWEYKIILIEIKTKKAKQEIERYKEIENILDESGKESWELISIIPPSSDFHNNWNKTSLIHLFLKRKME